MSQETDISRDEQFKISNLPLTNPDDFEPNPAVLSEF